jgi:transcriptional regulator with XRE-family HTH domain
MGWSQRFLAERAGLAYKTLQLLETQAHDPRLSTLQNLAKALGYPEAFIPEMIEELWGLDPDSAFVQSWRNFQWGEAVWKLCLFNFVDAFRSKKNQAPLIQAPVYPRLSPALQALWSSTVEALCRETGIQTPLWCGGIGSLPQPWFVSGVENLKAMALVESPVFFRNRNIFVLENFLHRA